MLLTDIIKFVADRTGENDRPTIIREINNEIAKLWYSNDIDGCLEELDIIPDPERIITLPWYVYLVLGVRKFSGETIALNTPRAHYQEYHYRQTLFEHRILGRTPLFRSLTAVGPLTLKLRKAAGSAFSVRVRGTDDYGVDVTEDVNFAAAERAHVTGGSYVNITALSKSAAIPVDVEVRDIQGTVVSIIPSSRNDVGCLRIQIIDKLSTAVQYPQNMFTVLFKRWAPYFTSETDSVADDLGVVLQRSVTAARLQLKTGADDQKRAGDQEGKAAELLHKTNRKQSQGVQQAIDLQSGPWYSQYSGVI